MDTCPRYSAGTEKAGVYGFVIDKSMISGQTFVQTDSHTIVLSHDSAKARR